MTDARTGPVPVMDIGGTHVTAALFDPVSGGLLEGHRHHRALRARAGRNQLLAPLLECASELSAPVGSIWGVAVPGPFDYRDGIARYQDVGKFESLNGVDLGSELTRGISSAPAGVRFLNDANAFGLGECTPQGAAYGGGRVLALTLGTGVGSAFLDHGLVVEDHPAVPPEGRVDLLEVDGRPLEETVSRRAIVASYGDLTGEQGIDVAQIARRATDGDQTANQVLHHAFGSLGVALRPWVDSFEVRIVVLGGSVAGSWNLVAEPLRSALGDVSVVPARLGEDAALVGAGTYVHSG